MKTPEAKLRELACHFDKRSTWTLAQGEDSWTQIEDSVPFLGLKNEKQQLRALLVKAIFE